RMTASLEVQKVILQGMIGSLSAGMCTALVAVLNLLRPQWSHRSQVEMLAFAAGVMLAASIFSLLLPAIEIVAARTESVAALVAEGTAGLGLGALAVWAGKRGVPEEA